ncbi:winged helix family two component transcriptional regulator [Candidatus Magnetobacterium bavaricum]|uniref:Winged helix family two component transcriptional regulator n=1 Tax=Candidatus Magnetobacterium bavaricum TaxID=29290 RepID=A0A0F3GJ12_9BACT|nr:winged helix family two component transcriptional regulator [Candidatus Magnetobacterium bavaricum]
MKILIVEDERHLGNILRKGLQEHSFSVDLAVDGEEGLYMAETYPYDAILLDLMLPKVDGLTILATIRSKKIETPVIVLTARAEVDDKIHGLDVGADDYISKPFNFSELLARLRAVLRRSKGAPSPYVTIKDMTIDTNLRTVKRAGVDINLTSSEYNLLHYMSLNKNRVIGRAELVDHLYNSDCDRDSNVIDVYINYLRAKIDKGFDKKLIHTVRGTGYVLKDDT